MSGGGEGVSHTENTGHLEKEKERMKEREWLLLEKERNENK